MRHPEHVDFLEEHWLFQAITETYVPLLGVFDRLADDAIDFRLTLTLSPTLLAMLADPLLRERYRRHLERLVALGAREVERTRREAPELAPAAAHHARRFEEVRRAYVDVYRGDLVAAFRRHRDAGRLEILACAASHGFLPLLARVPEAARAQVALGVAEHRRVLGAPPRGFWLPECGYAPGLDSLLAEVGIRFSFLEAHGIEEARPRPARGLRAPVVAPGGIAFFGRDPETSRQVWSAEVGYPGDAAYREFHRDAAWELPPAALGDCVADGQRRPLGLKYWRITGRGDGPKRPYDPGPAGERALEHARHFLAARRRQLSERAGAPAAPAIVVSPYDAELFGHWWHEGPVFLEAVLREAAADDALELTTPGVYLARHPRLELVQPPLSSWGAHGYAGVWLSPANDWIYPHLERAARTLVALVRTHVEPAPLVRRALAQAARELLLAQASDWAFMLHTGTTVDYARRRLDAHLGRFARLAALVRAGAIDADELAELEARDNLFPELDPRVYI